MKIGLIDVDGHNFPNLALMKISAYHKQNGDDVEWAFPMGYYDIVYQSKVFDDTYSQDIEWIPQAEKTNKFYAFPPPMPNPPCAREYWEDFEEK